MEKGRGSRWGPTCWRWNTHCGDCCVATVTGPSESWCQTLKSLATTTIISHAFMVPRSLGKLSQGASGRAWKFTMWQILEAFWNHVSWAGIQALVLSSCVITSKLLNLSKLWASLTVHRRWNALLGVVGSIQQSISGKCLDQCLAHSPCYITVSHYYYSYCNYR